MGGGVTFVEGSAAQFYNPANLMIQTSHRTRQITLGMGGIYYSNGMQIDRFDRFPEQIQPYFMPKNLPQTTAVSDDILLQMFSDDDHYYQTQKYDVIVFGASWQNGSIARSIALRSRGLSSFEMNRNWFHSNAEHLNDGEDFTRYLNENYHVYHELSVGLAREVTMFNRWQSGLNTLLIGLSPKLVFGGMHSEVGFRSEYSPGDGDWQNTKQFYAKAAGDVDRYISDLMISGRADQAFSNHLNPHSNLDINGYGLGLDAGLTYIIPIGNDVSLSPHIHEPLKKSLRFSIAVTDFGMVRFNENPREWNSRSIMRTYQELPETDSRYYGHPGEIFHYLKSDPEEQSVFENIVDNDSQAYVVQLPTEVHLGTAFQYNRFTSVFDMNYRFNSSDFGTNGWHSSLGTELRILRFLPIRGSVQMNADRDFSFGMGAGLNLGFVNLSGAIRIFNPDHPHKGWYTNSLSVMALNIRF